jgi:hypothetical protein
LTVVIHFFEVSLIFILTAFLAISNGISSNLTDLKWYAINSQIAPWQILANEQSTEILQLAAIVNFRQSL